MQTCFKCRLPVRPCPRVRRQPRTQRYRLTRTLHLPKATECRFDGFRLWYMPSAPHCSCLLRPESGRYPAYASSFLQPPFHYSLLMVTDPIRVGRALIALSAGTSWKFSCSSYSRTSYTMSHLTCSTQVSEGH